MKPRTLLTLAATASLSALVVAQAAAPAASQGASASLTLAGRVSKTFPAKTIAAYDGDKSLDGDLVGTVEISVETAAGTAVLRLPKKRSSCRLYYSFAASEGRGSASWRLGSPKKTSEQDFPFFTWDSEASEFDEDGRGTGTASYRVSANKISGTFQFRACRRRSATKVERYEIKGEFKDVPL